MKATAEDDDEEWDDGSGVWDQRALAYAAPLFSDQLKGGNWGEVKSVIAVNILGRKGVPFWEDEYGSTMDWRRRYQMTDVMGPPGEGPRLLPGMEVLQYDLSWARPDDAMAFASPFFEELRDWLYFLREAPAWDAGDVLKTITSPGVLKAFERAKLDQPPPTLVDAMASSET